MKKNLEKISDNERILGLYDVELARDYEERCRKKAHERKEKELKEKEETIKEKEDKIKEKEQNLQNKEQNLAIIILPIIENGLFRREQPV